MPNHVDEMKKPLIYKILLPFALFRYRKMRIVYDDPSDMRPGVFVANHARIDGPAATTLHFDRPYMDWIIHNALDKSSAPSYLFHDVFIGKSRKMQWFYRLLSRLLAPLLVSLLRHEPGIPVYHDARSRDTFRQSVSALEEGKSLLIFAESPKPFSPYVNALQDGFLLLGPQYYKKTQEALSFYPMYVCRKRRLIRVGKPIAYRPNLPLSQQRQILIDHLQSEITRLGETCPPHKPISFMEKRWYKAYGNYVDDFASYWKMIDSEGDR